MDLKTWGDSNSNVNRDVLIRLDSVVVILILVVIQEK
jgi:hypothetical protein